MDVPWNQLSAETLRGVIEEFVTREGTEYGRRDFTLDEKVEQVRLQLQRGEAKIVFNPEDETVSIVSSGE